MNTSTCQSCRAASRLRFHFRLTRLKDNRRRFSSTPISSRTDFVPQSWYWDTTAPTPENLEAASKFFQAHSPFRAWTGTGWRRHKPTTPGGLLVPEVVFLGRSNVGKSSLINHLTYTADLNRVSNTPGHTKTMWAWSLAAKNPNSGGALRGWGGDTSSKVTLVDMPGYGYGSNRDWGDEIITYMKNRKELRRAFVVIDAMQGITKQDRQIFEYLRGLTIPYQIVISKCDKSGWHGSQAAVESALLPIRQEAEAAKNKHPGLGELILVGHLEVPVLHPERNQRSQIKDPVNFGVTNLQWSILRAAGLDQYAMHHQKALASGKQKTYSAGTMVESYQSQVQAAHASATMPATTSATNHPTKRPLRPALGLNELLNDLFNTLPEARPSRPISEGSPAPFIELWKPTPAGQTEDEESVEVDSSEKRLVDLLNQGRRNSSLPPQTNTGRSPLRKDWMQKLDPFQDMSQYMKDDSMMPQMMVRPVAKDPSKHPRFLNQSPALRSGASHFPDEFNPLFDEMAPARTSGATQNNYRRAGMPKLSSDSLIRQTRSTDRAGKRVALGSDAYEPMFDNSYNPTQGANTNTQNRRSQFSSTDHRTPPPPQKPSAIDLGKGVAQGLEAFEAMFADDHSPPKGSKKKKGKSKSKSSAGSLDNDVSSPSKPSTPQMGKGVAQGLEAFEAMFADDHSPPKGSKKKKGKSKSKSSAGSLDNDVSSPSKPSTPQMGKGVAQGLEAFEAMFADEPSTGRKKNR
ncbi:ribosome biogenesis GTP-binding protein YsxC [Exophiala mesophila]|uniref:Ribosome biogenesis GTP-binding protein YsxC n=1 Tax=Exophiala mesophila TaxID=212818 RepID=A0A0D1ZSN6_EXOME|nr:ribosome biogenesis GTP-binding protein YsxC [Exophiala mesophila]KIV97552.1 ribosome biogenesis GTP-binding protein YsxC [Exophiala mesophila]